MQGDLNCRGEFSKSLSMSRIHWFHNAVFGVKAYANFYTKSSDFINWNYVPAATFVGRTAGKLTSSVLFKAEFILLFLRVSKRGRPPESGRSLCYTRRLHRTVIARIVVVPSRSLATLLARQSIQMLDLGLFLHWERVILLVFLQNSELIVRQERKENALLVIPEQSVDLSHYY